MANIRLIERAQARIAPRQHRTATTCGVGSSVGAAVATTVRDSISLPDNLG